MSTPKGLSLDPVVVCDTEPIGYGKYSKADNVYEHDIFWIYFQMDNITVGADGDGKYIWFDGGIEVFDFKDSSKWKYDVTDLKVYLDAFGLKENEIHNNWRMMPFHDSLKMLPGEYTIVLYVKDLFTRQVVEKKLDITLLSCPRCGARSKDI